MKRWIPFAILILILVGVAVWFELKNSDFNKEEPSRTGTVSESTKEEISITEKESESTVQTSSPDMSNVNSESFPSPTTEVVNGRTERTIHMGVRQYAWDPSTITVKKGELVRLIIHNADVKHGLVIPDLGIMEGDIPPEGAVIEFTPNKVGTFEFFCSVYCGEGHMEMRGKIIVE